MKKEKPKHPRDEYQRTMQINRLVGKTDCIVLSMMERGGLFHQGHRLYMDNLYTSVPLFYELQDRGTLACGTVRQMRRGLPEVLKKARHAAHVPFDHVEGQNMEERVPGYRKTHFLRRGECLFRRQSSQTQKGTPGNLLALVWNEKKHVITPGSKASSTLLLSSVHQATQS